ncbi:MAG: glycosyltransferase [Actinomycetota bacterium]
MRIGIIAPPWVPVPPPLYGGTEEVIDLLACGLHVAGHDVLLAAAADSTCPVRLVPGTATSDFAAMGTSITEAAHIVRAYGAMGDMDVIHDNTTLGPLYRHRPPGIPVVSTNHALLTPDTIAIRHAIAVDVYLVAISRRQVELGEGVPIAAMIHHGLDTARIPVGRGGGGYAAFLGRMNPVKGVVEAIGIARAAGMPLRIAAKMRDAGEQAYFEIEVRPRLADDVEYVGELDAATKYAFLGDAVALLNPIQWEEPFGLVMVEALATGTPVLATPRGAAPEIVVHGRTGFLAPTEDLVELLPRAAALDRRECRSDAVARFDATRLVADHLALYEGLVRSGATAA